jgi:hypothetical protein
MTPPPVLKPDSVERDGAWLLFETSLRMAEVPPEVSTREFRDTDPRDLDALAELCSLGMIRQETYLAPAKDLWADSFWQRRALDATSEAYGLPRCPADIDAERIRLYRRDEPLYRYPVHVAEVAYRVARVQNCADHVTAYLTGQPVHKVWDNCNDELTAWRMFDGIIEPALTDFHVHVRVQTGAQPSDADIGAVRATLYSVAILQLVNDLAEEVPYVTCANEACGRLFHRQRGRSEYGGHRTRGVMYCSHSCARAQYQREKRRRDRATQEVAGV